MPIVFDPQDPPPRPDSFDPQRVTFTTDGSGGGVTLRPRELISSAPTEDLRIAVGKVLAEVFGTDSAVSVTVRSAERTRQCGEPDAFDPVSVVVDDLGVVSGPHKLYRIDVEVDVLRLVRGLRELGVPAQPNHVYFVSTLPLSAAAGFAPNMFAPNMFAPNMFAPNMFAPNMFAPNMFAGGGGGGGGGCCPGGPGQTDDRPVPHHGARPVAVGDLPSFETFEDRTDVEVHVIDIATPGKGRPTTDQTGEFAKADLITADAVDENGDGWADPAMGHGDFVKSVVDLNCGVTARLWQAADPLGDIDDDALVTALEAVVAASDPTKWRIVNLSLAGYNEDDRPAPVLADQIARMVEDGWLVVASAGNNASCRVAYPAALPGVVAVGAISKCVPAWFSNYGPWVDVSARGVDVVAQFPTFETPGPGDGHEGTRVATDFDQDSDQLQTYDLADFTTGWATWSGTSFSAPLVAARLAQAMPAGPAPTGVDDEKVRAAAVRDTVADVIHRSDLDWLPYYGRILA